MSPTPVEAQRRPRRYPRDSARAHRWRDHRGQPPDPVPGTVARTWQGALARAVVRSHPAYDTLFVELAVRENRKLVTFDARLLETFPEVTCRPGALA